MCARLVPQQTADLQSAFYSYPSPSCLNNYVEYLIDFLIYQLRFICRVRWPPRDIQGVNKNTDITYLECEAEIEMNTRESRLLRGKPVWRPEAEAGNRARETHTLSQWSRKNVWEFCTERRCVSKKGARATRVLPQPRLTREWTPAKSDVAARREPHQGESTRNRPYRLLAAVPRSSLVPSAESR